VAQSLGYSAEEIAQLQAEGVLFSQEPCA
jgi:hypothetical protein